jgi:hypothetical protein
VPAGVGPLAAAAQGGGLAAPAAAAPLPHTFKRRLLSQWKALQPAAAAPEAALPTFK